MRFRLTATLTCAIIGVYFLPGAVNAQWLKYPTPGIPRLRDGKPNLTAPVPKTPDGKPDLSGIWQTNSGAYNLDIASDLKPGDTQPWAETLYRERSEKFGIDNPALTCLPGIAPGISMGMYKILQTPSAIAFFTGGDFRQVLTDGRDLPKDPNPTWGGYSVGHWEGETLVIESAGFNDKTWLDFGGHPHTEALRVTERLHRKDFGHMEVKITFDDPKAYNKPWTISMTAELVTDTELLEYVCSENERDSKHFMVTEEERKRNRTKVQVAPAVMAKYAGIYELVNAEGKPIGRDGKPLAPDAKPATISVSVDGDHLIVQLPFGGSGGAPFPLTAESENTFGLFGETFEFVKDAQGTVTHLIEKGLGDLRAVRKGDLPTAPGN
jgi:hypothetical protein